MATMQDDPESGLDSTIAGLKGLSIKDEVTQKENCRRRLNQLGKIREALRNRAANRPRPDQSLPTPPEPTQLPTEPPPPTTPEPK